MRSKVKVLSLMLFLLRFSLHDDVEMAPAANGSLQFWFPSANPEVQTPQAFDDKNFLKGMGIQV